MPTMGGDITVKSEHGKGSVFTAVIPQQPVEVVKLDGIIARWVPKEKQAAAGIERGA
jgi:hypothetical protein